MLGSNLAHHAFLMGICHCSCKQSHPRSQSLLPPESSVLSQIPLIHLWLWKTELIWGVQSKKVKGRTARTAQMFRMEFAAKQVWYKTQTPVQECLHGLFPGIPQESSGSQLNVVLFHTGQIINSQR